jgi:type II secretory pathway pseudopilin PulG
MPRTVAQWSILLTLAVLVVGAAFTARSFLISARDRSAIKSIRALERATQLYLNAHGVPEHWRFDPPADRTLDASTYDSLLSEFIRARLNLALPPNTDLGAPITDPWGRRFRIAIVTHNSTPHATIVSAGPDGLFDTADDVR